MYPESVTLHRQSNALALLWPGHSEVSLSAGMLRQACRCAHCENKRRTNRFPLIEQDIALLGVEPVGEMGLQLIFSDAHDRGIYPWVYLHELSILRSGGAT